MWTRRLPAALILVLGLQACASVDPVGECRTRAANLGLALGPVDPAQSELILATRRDQTEEAVFVYNWPAAEGRPPVACDVRRGRVSAIRLDGPRVWP
jgi:hypothetical protein